MGANHKTVMSGTPTSYCLLSVPFFICFKPVIFSPLLELATPFRPKTQISLSFLRAPRQPDLQSGDRNLNISVIIYSEKLQRQVDVRLTEHARGALSLICFAWRSSSLPDSSLDSVIMEETLGEEWARDPKETWRPRLTLKSRPRSRSGLCGSEAFTIWGSF